MEILIVAIIIIILGFLLLIIQNSIYSDMLDGFIPAIICDDELKDDEDRDETNN